MKRERKRVPVARASASLTPDARAYAHALGVVLRNARTTRGVTRGELASRLLIGTATLQRMEAGDARVSLGYYLATGLELGIPVLATQISPQLGPQTMAGPSTARASRKKSRDDWFGP